MSLFLRLAGRSRRRSGAEDTLKRTAALALLVTLSLGGEALAVEAGAKPAAKPAVPPSEAAADKLPVDLPSVVIRGEDESVAPLKGGVKLTPNDPKAPLSQLPPAPNAKAPGTLELAIEALRPDFAPPPETLTAARKDWTELQLGGGALYELGLFHGREVAGAVTETQLSLDSALPWMRARLGIDATWNLATAGLGLRHYHEDVPGGERLFVQSADLGGNWQREDLLTEGSLEFGRVQAPASQSNGLIQDQGTWTRALSAGALWKPQIHAAHVSELSATLGHRETDRRSDPTFYLRAFDHWTIDPRWSVEAGLGGGLYVGMPVLDPLVRVSYRPDDPTELSLGLTSGSEMPTFERLYQSRRLAEGNGGLLPQRSGIIASMSASHRLNDLWYATAGLDYRSAERYIYWEDSDQDGLWRPANTALGASQNVWGGELSARYQIGAVGSQRFHYRFRSVRPLGAVMQEAAAVHQRTLIPDRLSVEAGAAIVLDELGADQTAGIATSGWQITATALVNYRLTERIGLYGKLQDLPLANRQPSLSYYAPFGLALVGATVEF